MFEAYFAGVDTTDYARATEYIDSVFFWTVEVNGVWGLDVVGCGGDTATTLALKPRVRVDTETVTRIVPI